MRLTVVVVGKPRNRSLGAAIEEYEARAEHYWPLEVHEVKEEPARGHSESIVKEREGERLLARIPAGARLLACDAGGDHHSSEEFASWLGGERDAGRSVAFAIGGAFGLSPAVIRAAVARIALASWTLPHELARLVLAEQLYRAGTILRREPYHK